MSAEEVRGKREVEGSGPKLEVERDLKIDSDFH